MRRTALAGLVAASLAGCGVSADAPRYASPPMPRADSLPRAASFSAWLTEFRPRALAAGVSETTFDRAFAGVRENAEVARLDGAQAEFTKPIWEYVEGAASPDRIATGRAKAAALSDSLGAIEARFGVEREVVLAIWGMESNFGSFRGSIPVFESLGTLAYEGRRRGFAEEQLIAALTMVQSGDAGPGQMVGSWAGAMGHTQFMPTSYMKYATPFAGSGRPDIWSEDPRDALASTANYLRQNGWIAGQPWGLEVRLPAGFNYATADQANRRPVADWRARGVTRLDGSPLPDIGTMAVIAPGGVRGPAFAVFDNFFVIKTYNNATSYAMGVGHLADRIGGGGPIVGAWPRGERELSRTEKIELQRRLTDAGFDTGKQDGVVGPDTIAAIRAWQQAEGLIPDGFASAAVLDRLR